MEATQAFMFRAQESFVRETDEAARLTGLNRSEYARRAIEAANARAMHTHMAVLSSRLAAQTESMAEALDGSAADGLPGSEEGKN